jgi:hypothetical protein
MTKTKTMTMTGKISPRPVEATSGPPPTDAANPPHVQIVGSRKLNQRGTRRKPEVSQTKPG